MHRLSSGRCLRRLAGRTGTRVLRRQLQWSRSWRVDEGSVFNEAKIAMIGRRLREQIFRREAAGYGSRLPEELAADFRQHNIDVETAQAAACDVPDFELPPLEGATIDDHFRAIAERQSAEYVSQADLLAACRSPPLPKKWAFREGWTRYGADGSSRSVACPEEQAVVFDVEVVVGEGSRPCLAVAFTPAAWYSWASPSLVRASRGAPQASCRSPGLHELVPMFADAEEARRVAKCVVGHFVSFDRARVRDEYSLEGTRARFLDTMGLHMAICGLTGTQRSLKLRADKRRFKNKVWREFLEERSRFNRAPVDEEATEEEEDDNAMMSMSWLSESSLDNLIDVFRLHCGREPPTTKDPRNVFIRGSSADVVADFQALVTYCAHDVYMTHEVFRRVWPRFKRRFSHPVSMAGMLEMSTAFLPVNENWNRYMDRAEQSYRDTRQQQKEILMNLAEVAREKGEDGSFQDDPWLWDLDWSTTKKTKASESYHHLPKWYRELIPKPLKNHAHEGPVNVTLQTRVTPKLLRLSWEGLPLHHDDQLRWGYLMPGRDPAADKDPIFYDEDEKLRSRIPVERVGRGKEPTRQNMLFPYEAVVEMWSRRLLARLAELRDDLARPRERRTEARLQLQDSRLMEELRRSCEALPLEAEERERLEAAIRAVDVLMAAEDLVLKASDSKQLTDKHMNQLLCDLQVRGKEFWQDNQRYKVGRAMSKETQNPFIPTCWFVHLPHKEGLGKPVGNPLSKPFLRSIAEGQLRSEYGQEADGLLRSQIHCSYWQSSAQRIRDQIYIWLEEKEPGANFNPVTGTHRVGLILPQVKVIGTVTRRAVEKTWLTASNAYRDRLGSELKAMVQAPPGYRFVGADVDSQELWIAATLGDATVGIQGGTPFGWMVLQGSKKEGTDLHTVTSKMIGISRDSAKILNYARLYGAGQAYSAQLLQQFNPGISAGEAKEMARRLMEQTKGRRALSEEGRSWHGGTESATFNRLEEIALQRQPRTPILGARLTRALNPRVVGKDFMTSRVNWVVQSSAVDYLHCMLVCMRWLSDRFSVPARFSISIHDEVRYLVREDATDRAALALHITNLLTRALFVSKLGMHDLPQSVAFFSSVDVDRCLRKEPSDDCVTPSNKDGLQKTYGLPLGESLDITETLRRTGGQLGPPPQHDAVKSCAKVVG